MPEIVLAMRIELDGVPAELVATAASATARGTVVHFFFFSSSSSPVERKEEEEEEARVFNNRQGRLETK